LTADGNPPSRREGLGHNAAALPGAPNAPRFAAQGAALARVRGVPEPD